MEYWLYRLLDRLSPQTTTPLPAQSPIECTDPVTLDQVYSTLLQTLPLSAAHRQALRQRGLADREILRRRYRTLPLRGRAALARRLVDQYGEEVCSTVPGLYVARRNSRSWWSLAGAPGLVIPVRNLDGRIVALKVRSDDASGGAKYTYVSSRQHGGPGPGTPVHVPLHDVPKGDSVRLTEGELKGDLSTVLSRVLTVTIPGVTAWRTVLPVLKTLAVTHVLLAFDADWRTNAHVARAIGELGDHLLQTGYSVEVEDWYPTQAKGIDDLLAAGLTPTRRQSFFVYTIYFRGQCAQVDWQMPTVDVKEVPQWH